MAAGVRVVSSKIVGSRHRRMVLSQFSRRNAPVFQAIHFNVDGQSEHKNNFSQMVFKLRWNRWNGRKTAQLVVKDLQY
jgi:single-stranded-DNA-specific exonuclease